MLIVNKEDTSRSNIYLFKVENIKLRRRIEICSKLTIKTPERYQWLSRRRGSIQVKYAKCQISVTNKKNYRWILCMCSKLTRKIPAKQTFTCWKLTIGKLGKKYKLCSRLKIKTPTLSLMVSLLLTLKIFYTFFTFSFFTCFFFDCDFSTKTAFLGIEKPFQHAWEIIQ